MHHRYRVSPYPGSTYCAYIRIAPLALLAACGPLKYEADPLVPVEVLEELIREREAVRMPVEQENALTLVAATELLRQRSPELREALAGFHSARAVAEVETPWPDPTLQVGPEIGFGSAVDRNEVVAALGIGVAIPTGGRRAREDERNRALAEAARINAVATFLEVYIDLRARYFAVSVARTRSRVQEQIVQGAARSVESVERLAEAGGAQALDLSLFSLEYARERAHLLAVEAEAADAEHDLAELLALDGMQVTALSVDPLPERPDEPPSLHILRERLHLDNPSLQRLAAAYEVADRQLALEIARQFPDLELGIDAAGEPGESTTILGVLLGFAVPLFDRNRQAIAEAQAHRQEARVRYEAALDRELSRLARVHEAVVREADRRRVIVDEVLPAARRNLDVARTSLSAGSATGLQVLDAERSLREVELQALEADLQELLAWIALEQGLGAPLLAPHRLPDPPLAFDDSEHGD